MGPDEISKKMHFKADEKNPRVPITIINYIEEINFYKVSPLITTIYEDLSNSELKWDCAFSFAGFDLGMSGSGPGYAQTIIITPYMHSMIFHVPVMMRKHGSLRFFSGQGVCSFNVLSKQKIQVNMYDRNVYQNMKVCLNNN